MMMSPDVLVTCLLLHCAPASLLPPGPDVHHDDQHDNHHDDHLRIRDIRSLTDDYCPPRNEEAAKAQGLECVTKCDSANSCQNRRKLCLCDGLCGMSCIRPEKECPELPDPDNGQVHISGRHFQDQAVYTCDKGHRLLGAAKRVCQTSGGWSGATPECRDSASGSHSPYYCGYPPKIPNASHNGPEDQAFYDVDTGLSYQCFQGFRPHREQGFGTAKCFFVNGTATWYGPDLTCLPIDCGQPQDILHGLKTSGCTSFRCQTTYQCQPGFQVVGGATRICQADGTWTRGDLPTCIPVQCDIPHHPLNGKAQYTAVSYKSVVSYSCNYGYMLAGNGTRTCDSDRRWSGAQPECVEINCGWPSQGLFPNGWFEGSRTNLNAVITFRCHEGMKFEGEKQQATCRADGKWSIPVPQCLAPCIIPQIEEGVASEGVGEKVTHGDQIFINCTENYEVNRVGEPIECQNGTWSQIPRCVPARCKTMPTPPQNGMIVAPSLSHGASGLYHCKDGYELRGESKTTCVYGNWTGMTPSCKEQYCRFPGYLDNGKILLVGNMGLYDYRPYVRKITNNRQIIFDCDKGWRLALGSAEGATCIGGEWSPTDIPTCVKDNHPDIKWLV